MGNKVDAMSTLDTVPERVRYLSEVAPHKELFVFYDGHQRSAYTAADVYQMAGRFATKLRQRGFQRHDIVANTLLNSPERVVTDLGIILAGCVAMNSQIILADGKDFVHAANKSECKGVIMSTAGNSPAWSLLKGDVTEEKPSFFARVANQQLPHLQTAVLVSRATNGHGLSFLEELKSCTDEPFAEDIRADDTVVIFSTSGTTGYSKLVPHSNHHILQMSSAMAEAARGRGTVAHPGLNTQPFYNDRLLGEFIA
ncbi:uncharacterized protein LOC131951461 [Physella acuta]|uniref:uncharacterized protein LOC131951461 n=1 Tax=Physella acuta TaxID=109671 RepID=UPI0027DE2551|nr:uncharacterized protein LOC131951461 [Physella acuta]